MILLEQHTNTPFYFKSLPLLILCNYQRFKFLENSLILLSSITVYLKANNHISCLKTKSHSWENWTSLVVPWFFKNGKNVIVTALYFSIHCKQKDDHSKTKLRLYDIYNNMIIRLYDNYNENENDNEKLITSLRHI